MKSRFLIKKRVMYVIYQISDSKVKFLVKDVPKVQMIQTK